MKILNTYYGREAHNFNAEPYHAWVRYDASDDEIQHQKEKAVQSLKNRKCFWYVVHILEINPHTGATDSTYFTDTVGEKAKIILNGKPKKTEAVPPKAPTATLDGLIGQPIKKAPVTEGVPLPPHIKHMDLHQLLNEFGMLKPGPIDPPFPAPLQETELPF